MSDTQLIDVAPVEAVTKVLGSTKIGLVTDKPVLVTGASGYLASHIVRGLLKKGYQVRGTVRSLKDAETKYDYLYGLDSEEKQLVLATGQLTVAGSYDEAAQGCDICIHTASPYATVVEDPMRDLVDPAVNGTLNVLKSCVKAGIKKVVLTSSWVAVGYDEPEDKKEYTEADWNDKASINRSPYAFSKYSAEKAAWKFVGELPEDQKISMRAVNPCLIIGATISKSKSTKDVGESNQILHKLFTGGFPAMMDLSLPLVDVVDAATSHIAAMENDSCEGRNLCCSEVVNLKDLVMFLKPVFKDYKHKLPSLSLACPIGTGLSKLAANFQDKETKLYLQGTLGKHFTLNNSKLTTAGVQFKAGRQAAADSIQWMIDEGILDTQKKA